jgi:hypothetical protein
VQQNETADQQVCTQFKHSEVTTQFSLNQEQRTTLPTHWTQLRQHVKQVEDGNTVAKTKQADEFQQSYLNSFKPKLKTVVNTEAIAKAK